MDWDPDELRTDPELPDTVHDELTKRRCGGRCAICDRVCGQEIPRDDAAFKSGGVAVLESLYAALVSPRVGIDPAMAARIVQAVARDSGITLV